MSEHDTQTEDGTSKVVVSLSNLSVYVQQRDENIIMMSRIDRLGLDKQRSERGGEILIRVRQLPSDPECRDGLADVLLDNVQLKAYMFNVLGLAELVDDDDDVPESSLKRKESMPANIIIKNSRFKLSDDPVYERIDDDPKLIPISIERLELKKFSNGAIEIIHRGDTTGWSGASRNGLLQSQLGFNKEIEFLNQFKYDLTFLEFNSKFKFNSSKFASLVHLLREAKKSNASLEDEKTRMQRRLDEIETENRRLREELSKKKKSEEENNGGKQEDFYYESAMKAIVEENETIRRELENSKEMINVLNIEREKYLKLLNET